MRKIISFMFFLFTCAVNSQVDTNFLFNEWIKVKNEMLDGSKDISEPFLKSKFLRLKISKLKICSEINSISDQSSICHDYSVKDDFLKISTEYAYEIEKLTADTLIVIERINNVEELDKIRKYWFVSSKLLRDKFIFEKRKDTILIANELFTPKLRKSFIKEIQAKFKEKSNFPDFSVIGNIIIYPNKNIINVEVLNNNKEIIKNKKNVDFIEQTIEKSFNDWDLTDFMNFEKIYIPFIIDIESKKSSSGTYNGSRILFFSKNLDDLNKINGIKMNDLISANDNFIKGVNAFNDRKYEKALDYFKKSYEIDNRKIDALYNIASIYRVYEDKKNKCFYLKILKSLEQKDGSLMYDTECSGD